MPVFSYLAEILKDKTALFDWLKKIVHQNYLYEGVCWNIVREFKANNINKDKLEAFLTELDEFIRNFSDKSFLSDPFKTIELVLYRDIDKYEPGGEYCLMGYDIRGKYHNCIQSKKNCYDIDTLTGYDDYICRFETLTSFHRGITGTSHISYENALDYAYKVQKGEIVLIIPLRGRRPFCWVTKKEALGIIFTNKDSQSAVIVLGLAHFLTGEEIVVTEYPINFKFNKIAKPTFIEGIQSPFRVDISNSKWGKTVNLETGEDSLPEAVHCPHKRNKEFKVTVWKKPGNFKRKINWSHILTRNRTNLE